MVGIASQWSRGWTLLPVGALLGVAIAALVLPRRLWVDIGPDGFRSSSVRHVDDVRWADVEALGVIPSRMGRFGRSWTAGACVRGQERVVPVRALTVRSPVLNRLGDEDQDERLQASLGALLDPLLPAVGPNGIAVIDGDLVTWWDRRRG